MTAFSEQHIAWRKSSYSADGGNCVEVAPLANGRITMREQQGLSRAGAGLSIRASGEHSFPESRAASSTWLDHPVHRGPLRLAEPIGELLEKNHEPLPVHRAAVAGPAEGGPVGGG